MCRVADIHHRQQWATEMITKTVNANTEAPELLTRDEAAKLLNISLRTFSGLVSAGKAPSPVRLSVHPRWRRSELMEWINQLPATR